VLSKSYDKLASLNFLNLPKTAYSRQAIVYYCLDK